jgi:hypothetical protein
MFCYSTINDSLLPQYSFLNRDDFEDHMLKLVAKVRSHVNVSECFTNVAFYNQFPYNSTLDT